VADGGQSRSGQRDLSRARCGQHWWCDCESRVQPPSDSRANPLVRRAACRPPAARRSGRIMMKRLLASLLLLTGSAIVHGQEKAAPVVVEVAVARTAQVAPRTWIPGSVVSRDDARIAAVVAGRVVWIAEVGQRIEENGVVARVDDAVVKMRVD